eukprot:TRINITY_DN7929_c0_g1_i5.p1 TRINITY_DN7929_c0_g1~~TRINITY_DN7929_c0_g1_i5.p1  ORF type:complete len:140 (+),score=27.99 TRINITY_DN7929_c0_g1_i5:79-498(+)
MTPQEAKLANPFPTMQAQAGIVGMLDRRVLPSPDYPSSYLAFCRPRKNLKCTMLGTSPVGARIRFSHPPDPTEADATNPHFDPTTVMEYDVDPAMFVSWDEWVRREGLAGEEAPAWDSDVEEERVTQRQAPQQTSCRVL